MLKEVEEKIIESGGVLNFVFFVNVSFSEIADGRTYLVGFGEFLV